MKRYSLNKSFHPEIPIFLPVLAALIIYISLSISYTYSQQPTQEWVARIPGPSSDLFGPFLQVDKNGNSYIAGTRVINDSINILCAKYNTDGVQQWLKLYKHPGYGYLGTTGLALDSFGNAYVIGGFAPTSVTPVNALIIKFNGLNGNSVWAKSYFGTYGLSAFYDIKIDRMNNIYVVGGADSSHLVIKYNINGDSVWVRNYHPFSTLETTQACTIDDSLNVIFTGYRRFYYPPFGYYDSLLVGKYSASGILRWESVYANDLLTNRGKDIVADQNGNLYIGGITRISGLLVFLTMKYDRNGIRQWAKIFDAPGGGDNNLNAIAIDNVNNSLMVTGGASTNGVQMATTLKYNLITGDSIWVRKDTGTFSRANNSAICVDSSGFCYTTGGSYNLGLSPFDIMSRKYSSLGNPIWSIMYNGPFNGIDYGIDLGLDKLRNIYVLGTSESGAGLKDYVIIKYNQLLGINPISNNNPTTFKLEQNFPNPFNPQTNIRFSVAKKSFVQLRVFDVLGRVVKVVVEEELKPSFYQVSVDGSSYSSGVYFYQLTADDMIIDTKKLVIIK